MLRTKYIVAEGQKGLLYINKKFEKVLETGMYTYWNIGQKTELKLFETEHAAREIEDAALLALIEKYPTAFADVVDTWATGQEEVGLVYENDILKAIKRPGIKGAYWKGVTPLRVEKVNIAEDYHLTDRQASLMLGAADEDLRNAASKAIAWFTVADGHAGFLEVEGRFAQMLAPGYYAWWRYGRSMEVKTYDQRLQNIEVNGQEILTKDKVSLRINLSATWQVRDAKAVYENLADHKDYLYREMQLALRTVVSTQTLDQLLADKNLLNQQVLSIVSDKADQYGLKVKTIGARDIVLPGEMKTILAQVVEAEKLAEANLIRRREETQATRSLHNTAKVMEGNPVLLRLKELETLEKITTRINSLNVYGGLDGVMNDMVKIPK